MRNHWSIAESLCLNGLICMYLDFWASIRREAELNLTATTLSQVTQLCKYKIPAGVRRGEYRPVLARTRLYGQLYGSSSVRTLVEQIQLFSGIDVVLSGANL